MRPVRCARLNNWLNCTIFEGLRGGAAMCGSLKDCMRQLSIPYKKLKKKKRKYEEIYTTRRETNCNTPVIIVF